MIALRQARCRVPVCGSTAFTLVELLIVIVLVAIAASLVVPMLAGTDDSRLRAASRLLIADLAFAQIESITHADDPRLVSFDQANNSYTIAASSAPTTPINNPALNQPYVTQFGSGRASEMTGVTIQSHSLGGDDQVVFGILGQLDQADAATVTLQAGNIILTVQIDPTTGEASIIGGGS
ncbi:MAG: prepilin-type N-terminal cleavage/methylation domain-containing protein [Phycisphaerae bacterium]|nr:prepilin-type N-terminal cleavage/methylation domain-containing protein [Phycisphaerae bacterium]